MTDQKTSKGAGWLLFALCFLNVLNFADRYLIISFSAAIIPDLGLTNLQFGLLTGFVFTGFYTVMGLFAGSLSDRLSRPTLIAAGLAIWSALTAATGLARSFAGMAAARMFVGVGEACLTPAAVSMLADLYPRTHRAFASGVYYMGFPLGVGGSFLFAAAVGPTLGWRGGFFLLGSVGVVTALLVYLFMDDPPRGKLDGPAAERVIAGARAPSFKGSFRGIMDELRTNPAFALTLAGGAAFAFVQGGGILDLVWWVKERGYTQTQAQQITGLVFMLGGMLGAVLGGVGADWAVRRYSAGRLKFLGFATLVALPLMIAYRLVPGHTPIFYLLALFGAIFSMLLFGPLFSTIQELVPVQHRGSAIALCLLCGAFIGASSGNAVVGYLVDTFAGAGILDPITRATLLMAVGMIVPAPLFFLAARFQTKQLQRQEVALRENPQFA